MQFVIQRSHSWSTPRVISKVVGIQMWGYKITGITMPPGQDQTKLMRWEEIPVQWRTRSILYIVHEGCTDSKTWIRGPKRPYIGSVTKQRAKKAPLQVMEVSKLHETLLTSWSLIPWVKGDKGLTNLFTEMIKEKTTPTHEDLSPYVQKIYSGSLTHRLPSQAVRMSAMANMNLNLSVDSN